MSRPGSLVEVARRIPPDVAQATMARVMAVCGAHGEWNADMVQELSLAIEPVRHLPGLPAVSDIDDADFEANSEFWRRLWPGFG